MLASTFLLPFFLVGAVRVVYGSLLTSSVNDGRGKTCIVRAGGSDSIDDAPAILDAFQTCGQDGKVMFSNTTYHINSVMNTTGLKNCEINLHGTLLVCNTSFLRRSRNLLIAVFNLVGHKYKLLAQSFAPRWLSEPVNSMDYWRGSCGV